ncbi:twin-arginine translocase subunit TatC [Isoptericola sp. b441]|uniref:Sec-independent protein translocase protein TatC n=1 Tax=Actinotalea lenta TaxID=3064654 RepID=A0ABT9DA10_9CELL|nr:MULTISPECIES: twin-arginine translocase subunit TatC [unclassified Isoptericola]MDO8107750.1 twin-arginine translocase subunit TatC [Isoptericola sp. b441]MDO8120579.1 twin-arginine translocase subunit TatC [Isoptericola sp. b490]
MPLLDHLRELRRRILLATVGVVIGAVVGWLVYTPLFEALQKPILDLADRRGTTALVNFAGVAASLDIQIKVSLFAGVILSSPWWIYQLWAFIAPGLTHREKRYTLGFVAAAVPLFLAGAAIAWLMLPKAVAILTGFTPPGAGNIIDAQTYLTFVMQMVLAFGLAFLLPVVMVGLTLAGLVRAATWLAGWRWAVMGSAVFAAVATPTSDALSMFILMVPIVVLYFAAIGVGMLADHRRDARLAAEGLR